MKFKNGCGKWILREALNNYLPNNLFSKSKHGFNVPLAEWLRGPLKPWAENLLDEKRIQSEGYFHYDAVKKLWIEHQSKKWDRSPILWNLIMFELWLDVNSID
jgi:asparagine synthase (glutamine-hydrolysing)